MAETKGLPRHKCLRCNRNDFGTLTLPKSTCCRTRQLSLRGLIPKNVPRNKNKMPKWAFDFYGGDEGIRTLDTLASIPHFQCGALDQLCDVS